MGQGQGQGAAFDEAAQTMGSPPLQGAPLSLEASGPGGVQVQLTSLPYIPNTKYGNYETFLYRLPSRSLSPSVLETG